jgi:hypothetical protein
MCYNRYKQVLQTMCSFVPYSVLYHNLEVLLKLKKALQQTFTVILDKCSDTLVNMLQTMYSTIMWSVTRAKKNVTTKIIVTLDKYSCRQVNVLQ